MLLWQFTVILIKKCTRFALFSIVGIVLFIFAYDILFLCNYSYNCKRSTGIDISQFNAKPLYGISDFISLNEVYKFALREDDFNQLLHLLSQSKGGWDFHTYSSFLCPGMYEALAKDGLKMYGCIRISNRKTVWIIYLYQCSTLYIGVERY